MLVIVLGVIFAAVGLAAALRRLHPARWTSALLTLTTAVGLVWIVDGVLITTDYRDADGFIDCGLYCSTLQGLVAVVFWYGGTILLLTILFSLGALVVLSLRKPRD